MTETVTKRDLIEQNVDKVFPEGPTEIEPETHGMGEIMARPGGSITAADLDAAKALAMAGPIIPEFIRGNPGSMLAAMIVARRFAKYDERTNSWISFDPIAVAQCMYLVESQGKQSIGYTSQFIGAVIDQFVPWQTRMRFTYMGQGEDRVCIASAVLKGDLKPFEYQTPPLKIITPKKSPLWQSDPDRQLAYYARRAWARLHVPGVLLGVYDVEELEGDARQHRGPDRAKDVTEASAALHQRLAERAAAHGEAEPEGFHPDAVDRGMAVIEEDAAPAPREARGRASAKKGKNASAKAKSRPGKRPSALARPAPAEKVERQQAPSKAALPVNAREYRRHVEAWLTQYDTEQDIEAQWRAEMRLRNQCGVVEEERAAIRTLIDQRIQQVRK